MIDFIKVNEILDKFYKEFPSPYTNWPNMRKDHEALIVLLNQFSCETLLEIGTWQSYTARLIYESGLKKITTMDIFKGMNIEYSHPVHKQQDELEMGKYLRPVGIVPCFHDSMTYVPTAKDVFDAVFIDANHDYVHVKNDTYLALKMATKLVMWHDYQNGNPEVDKWLNEFRAKHLWQAYPGSSVVYLILEGRENE